MADETRLLITASLNVGLSLKEINTRIQALEKHPSLQKIKIKMDIDDKFITTINSFTRAVEKMKKISDDQNKVVREEIEQFKRLDGTVETLTKKILKNGEFVEQSRKVHDDNKKALLDESKAAEKLSQSIDSLNKSNLDSIKINQNREGKTTGISVTDTKGNVKTNTRLEADGQTLVGRTIVTDYKKARDANEKLKNGVVELRQELVKLAQVGVLSKQQLANVASEANKSQNLKSLEVAREKLAQITSIQKELLSVEQVRYKNDKEILEQIALEKRKTDELEHQLQLYKQQAAINIQTAKRRFDGLIDSKALDENLRLINQLTTATPQVQKEMKNLSMGFKQIETNAKTASGAIDIANKSTISIGEAIKTAAIKFPLWVGISALFYGSARALKDLGVQIKLVDTQMTELNRVSENFNLTEMLQESVNIADDLSQKITEVNEALIQASRMGLEGQDLYSLTRAAVLMASISDLNSEEALNNLSSAMTQFSMSASEAVSIVDKLNAVDNDYVTSTKDLSQSISKAGAVSKSFGIELNTLLAYTVATSEATRESGNIIGNSIKSWATRITTMSGAIGGLKDVGVDVFNPLTGEVRKVEDIIESLSVKWDTLSSSTQQSLGLLIAGRHHVSRFTGLMNNYASVADVVTTAVNSQGSAMAENEKFQRSLEGQLAKLSNSWVNFATTLGELGLKDFFSNIIKGATDVMNGFTQLTKATDAWNLKLPLIIGGVYALSRSLGVLGVSVKGLRASLGWISALLVGAEVLFSIFTDANRVTAENTGAMIENSQQMSENADQINKLVSRYEELKPLATESKEAQDELNTVMESLQKIAPQLTGSLSDQNDALDFNAKAAREYADSLRGMSKELLEATKNSLDLEIIGAEDNLTDAKDGLNEYKEEYENTLKDLNELEVAYGVKGLIELEKEMTSLIGKGKEGRMLGQDLFAFADIAKSIRDSGYKEELAEIQELESKLGSLKDRSKSVQDLIAGTTTFAGALKVLNGEEDEYVEGMESAEELQDAFKESISKTTQTMSSLSSAYDSLNEGETLSQDTLLDLISTYPDLAKHLATTNDLTFNKGELIKYVMEQERNKAILETKNAIDSIEITRSELQQKQDLYFDFYSKMLSAGAPAQALISMGNSLGLTDAEKKSLDAYNGEIDKLQAKLLVLKQPLSTWSTSKEPKKEKKPFDPFVPDEYARSIALVDQSIQSLTSQQSRLSETSSEHITIENELISKLKEKQVLAHAHADALRAENIQLASQMSKLSKSSEKYSDLNEKLHDNEDTIIDLGSAWTNWDDEINASKKSIQDLAKEISENLVEATKNVLDKQSEIRDHLSSMGDDIVDIYKEVKDAAIKAIDAEIKLVDKNIAKYEDLYDAKMKMIDDTEADDDYKRNLLKLQDEQLDIEKDLNVASLNNDISNKKRREDLQKSLADKTNEINELKHDREIELQKDSLASALEVLKKDEEAKKDNLETKKSKEEEYWDEQTTNEEKYAQIREQVLSGSFGIIMADFANFKTTLNANSSLIGEGLTKDIIDKMNSMGTQMTSVGDEMGTLFSELGTTLETDFLSKLREMIDELNKLNLVKTDALNAQLQLTLGIIDNIAAKLKETKWGDMSIGEQNKIHADAILAMKTFTDANIGTTASYNQGTGQWTVKDALGGTIAVGGITEIRDKLASYKPATTPTPPVITPPVPPTERKTVQIRSPFNGEIITVYEDSPLNIPANRVDSGSSSVPTAPAPAQSTPTNGGGGGGGGSSTPVVTPPVVTPTPTPTPTPTTPRVYTYQRKNGTTFQSTNPNLNSSLFTRIAHKGDLVDSSKASPMAKALHDSFNLNKNERLMKLLDNEVVIQPDNIKPNFMQNMLGNMKMPNYSGITGNAAVASGGDNIFQFHVKEFNGTKQEAESFVDMMISAKARRGIN